MENEKKQFNVPTDEGWEELTEVASSILCELQTAIEKYAPETKMICFKDKPFRGNIVAVFIDDDEEEVTIVYNDNTESWLRYEEVYTILCLCDHLNEIL